MRRPAAVTALRRHVVQTRFVPDSKSGPKLDAKLADRIPEVRRLLRTDLAIIWYRKARRIDAHEAAQINEALRLKREKDLANELHDIKAKLAKFESSLRVQGNPNIHR